MIASRTHFPECHWPWTTGRSGRETRGAARGRERRGEDVSALPRTPSRLPSEIFDLPVEKMREGYYSDAYFVFTKQVLERDAQQPRVLMQVFQRHHSVLGGM